MAVITVRNLGKKFAGSVAVDTISFSVRNGEIFGLLGPNGAGKTTTIHMLSTLLSPTSGSASVAGYDVIEERESVRKSIGIVFQEPALDNKLTGRENLDFHAMLYGLGKGERKKRVQDVLALVELSGKSHVLVEKYSGGMKRRLEIARGLLHRPKVLFLDEPTLGLDAQTRRRIWEYIRKLNRENAVAIILTTHYMEEADALCKRVAIIDHGRIIAMGTPQKLKDELGGDGVSLDATHIPDAFVKEARRLRYVESVTKHDSTVTLAVEKGEKRIPELISMAQKNNMTVTAVRLHRPSLEDVFLHATGKTIREQEAGRKEQNAAFVRRRGFGR